VEPDHPVAESTVPARNAIEVDGRCPRPTGRPGGDRRAMEHFEPADIHSGDSALLPAAVSLGCGALATIRQCGPGRLAPRPPGNRPVNLTYLRSQLDARARSRCSSSRPNPRAFTHGCRFVAKATGVPAGQDLPAC